MFFLLRYGVNLQPNIICRRRALLADRYRWRLMEKGIPLLRFRPAYTRLASSLRLRSNMCPYQPEKWCELVSQLGGRLASIRHGSKLIANAARVLVVDRAWRLVICCPLRDEEP